MNKKLMLLTLAAVSAAMFAVPSIASAGNWNLDGAFPAKFTIKHTGTMLIGSSSGNTVECTTITGSGQYNNATSGVLTLKYHSCKDLATGTTCTGTADPAGTISSTANLTFQNVYLEKDVNGVPHNPGITIKGVTAGGIGEHVATFKCKFGLLTTILSGTVLAALDNPGVECNNLRKELAIKFETTAHGVQRWNQVTTTGAIEDLTAMLNGTPETAALVGTTDLNLENSVTATCTA